LILQAHNRFAPGAQLMAFDHALSSRLLIPDARLRESSHWVIRDDGIAVRMLIRDLRVGKERAKDSHRVISMSLMPLIADALVTPLHHVLLDLDQREIEPVSQCAAERTFIYVRG